MVWTLPEVHMRDDAVERVFSLFTTSDHACAMTGDLAEEREQRGSIWFWLHVVRVTFTLWWNAAAEAPLRLLALITAGLVILSAPALAGLASVGLFPPLIGTALNWITLSFFWCGGALGTGSVLVAMAPRRGMAACAFLAAGGAAALLALSATIDLHELNRVDWMFFVVALGATVALLAGASIARGRTVVLAVPFAVAIGCTAGAIVLMSSPVSSAQQQEWRDPSPHKVTLVTVEEGVQLQVLDWGGSGQALLLLAGGGDTAHVYDDVAPTLAAKYRVVGVTRRGHPGSSAPATGYGVARLAEDLVRVIGAVDLKSPIVVGHSFAGEEMHVLGARHAARVAGLVYVDAAFDRGDDADTEVVNAVAKLLPTAPRPAPENLVSFAALRAHLQKYGGAGPEAHLRARWVGNPDGSVGGMFAPEKTVLQAMSKEMRAAFAKPYSPERIRVPAVSIYAIPKSADDLIQRGSSDRQPFPELAALAAGDPAIRERVEKLFLLTRDRVRKHEKWFEAFAERGRVVELSGTHHLIISNPTELLPQIESFVSSLTKP